LYSFFIADDFHKVMRNSGFIISTILIRLSFSNVGLLNNLLIICAIIYGLFILIIHNKYQKFLVQERVKSTKS
jgi:Ni/Fe-hydrogenase subunit HybB-like protein